MLTRNDQEANRVVAPVTTLARYKHKLLSGIALASGGKMLVHLTYRNAKLKRDWFEMRFAFPA